MSSKRLRCKCYGKKISRFEKGGIVFEDQLRLASDLTMFIPAGEAPEQGYSAEFMAGIAAVNASIEHCAQTGKMEGYQKHLNISLCDGYG